MNDERNPSSTPANETIETPPAPTSTPSPEAAASSSASTDKPADTTNAKIVYVLYLVGLVIGLTALVGVVMAYVKRGEHDQPEWLESHYSFQIQTFWYGLAYLVVGALLSMIVIGWLVLLWWMIWLVVRCVKGLSALDRQATIEGTLFGFGDYR
ncbi:MAG: DUF4870 family protein [Hydrogenovibrio sp.]